MRIGIISNTDNLLPIAYTLAAQKLQVYLFYSPSSDAFANQKVHSFATQLRLNYHQENNPQTDIYSWLNQGNYDACFIIGYGRLIDTSKIANSLTPIFNIHFGALPGFKGPIPVFWQLKYGVPKLTASIHYLSQKFDDGPVIWSKQIDNLPHYNYHTANQALTQMSIEGVFYLLNCIATKQNISTLSTTGSKTGYQKRPTLADVCINWQQTPASDVCNLIRACNPWNKGALTTFNGNELKLMDAQNIDAAANQAVPPGTIVTCGNSLNVQCADGKTIGINMLYFNDCFVPAYQSHFWGLTAGQKLG